MMSLQHDEATNGICTAASRSYKWYMYSRYMHSSSYGRAFLRSNAERHPAGVNRLALP